jgi:lipoprotein-anchoring transpeptidase ErfK/SrfK
MAPRRAAAACFAVLALLGAGCGDFPDGPASANEVAPASVEPAPAPNEFLEVGGDQGSTDATRAEAKAAEPPESLERWQWALRAIGEQLNVYAAPRATAELQMSIDAANPWDQRIAFPIRGVRVRGAGTWYRVLLGVEPNHSSGWVRGEDVTFDRIRHRVVIDLSQRVLRHYRNDELRHRFSVGIGAPATPTTTGRFFVWAHLDPRDAMGPYGTYLLGLSGFSEVLTDWPGGGRMAIHGTADPGDRGQRVSYGCARVYNPEMNELRHIQMGTTVLIRR